MGLLVLRMAWSRVLIMALLITAVSSIIVLWGIAPFSSLREQRSSINEMELQVHDVQRENEQLQQQIDRLSSYEEIERVARQDHGLVYPGEKAYVVLPPTEAELEIPPYWPYIILEGHLQAVQSQSTAANNPSSPISN